MQMARTGNRLQTALKRHWMVYLMAVPVMAYYIVFCYLPMFGIVIAFQDFRVTRGFFRSDWVGLEHFVDYFDSIYAWQTIRNTLSISLLGLIFGFPAPILLALMLNEVTNTKFKRTVQTITYMPYFISLVVTCSLIKIYCQENGLFSDIAEFFGGTRQNLMINPGAFRSIYVISGIWQSIGWNSIIYLAALSGIDQEQYEAARIDGANEFQAFYKIAVPLAKPILATITVMNMISLYGDFIWPLLVIDSNSIQVISVAVQTYSSSTQGSTANYGAMIAGFVMATIPLLVMFLFSSRLYIEGITSGAVKA